MPTPFKPILRQGSPASLGNWPLHNAPATRRVEHQAAQSLAPHSLMLQAGLAVAQLALALAPHAQKIWVACGPGNNGGDGLEAARLLQAWGKQVWVTRLPFTAPPSADVAHVQALAEKDEIAIHSAPPEHYDLCIDALFGYGLARPVQGVWAEWIDRMNRGTAPVLSVDLPSGLNGDTGCIPGTAVRAHTTLALMTLKPGLFTGQGRDHTGELWLHTLGATDTLGMTANLNPAPPATVRSHNSHKGSYGDVLVIGGAAGMQGAGVLAARAALHGGAGRVYLHLLDATQIPYDPMEPTLMLRNWKQLDLASATVVCGCGGGSAIAPLLAAILKQSKALVLDADALNAVASQADLRQLLVARAPGTTILTPHPLEAARLLGISTAKVQADRLAAAQTLAEQLQCTVVLKGSGTVIAAPHTLPRINPSGNALLACAGTGDVLAGLIGACWAGGLTAWEAASHAVYQHGLVANQWTSPHALTASALAMQLGP